MSFISCILLLASGQQSLPDPKPYSPNDTVLFMLSDLQSVDPESAKKYRYLALHNIPAAKRPQYIRATINFVTNSLSRRQSIVFVQPVAGSNGAVVRVPLHEYRIDPQRWDDLARKGSGPARVNTKTDQPEPYYTLDLGQITQQPEKPTTKKVHRKDAQGRLLYMGGDTSQPVYDEVTVPAQTASGLAPGTWFDITAWKAACALTGSEYPLLRADWFIYNASLNPGYSELLGIKTLADFNKLVRFRQEDQDLSGRAVVADSQLVSLHQRGIEYTPKTLGSYWQTYDYKTSTGLNDLLKDPLKKRRDAGEAFAELPNGLQAFTLVNEKDEVIDVADGNIVGDRMGPWKNSLVWNGLYSCTNCHKNGAQDVLDEVRPLTNPPRGLVSKNKKEFDEFTDKYTKNIDAELANTRARYASAVLAATGLKPEENTAQYVQAFIEYIQKPLTINEAAAEVGCTPQQLTGILGRILNPDPAVTTLLAGRPLRRDLWEVAFPLVATAVYKEIKK